MASSVRNLFGDQFKRDVSMPENVSFSSAVEVGEPERPLHRDFRQSGERVSRRVRSRPRS